jgi:aspartyl protease family protein
MEKSQILTMMAIGLVGAFVGQLEAPDSQASSSSSRTGGSSYASAGSTSSRASASSSDSGDQLVLERHADGHFYADVAVNGVPISMLVDTGASAVALSAEDARRAGIATTIGMNEVVGEGAGGAVQGDIVTIDRISLGGTEMLDVPAAVLKGGSTSLLGQSFLREFDTVEISGDRMHLR